LKKLFIAQAVFVTLLFTASPVFAQSADVAKVQSFIQSIIQVLLTVVGSLSVVFFIFGGFRYITSTGNPESMDGAKKTILYSAIGLAIALGAFVLSNIVSQLATAAFGK